MDQQKYQNIEFSIVGGLATLVLNRPNRLNSFNTEMHIEVKTVLKQLSVNGAARCLLITGSGRGFCAGQDLSDRSVSGGDQVPDLSASIRDNYNPLIRAITALEMPVICAVNGVAAGAGANIALACDIVIAGRSASFIQSFNKLGLVPDSGGTWMLPRLIGHARAMRLCLLGEKVSAAKALEMGMISEVVEDDDLLTSASDMGRQLANAPTLGLALIKRALLVSGCHSLDQQLDLECELQGVAGRSNDYREGVSAFMEKRLPKYQGC
ncbi:MAG: 2-(1,2-epoxy-1,2-dihydrophenyl)acetyl-CoA isomerase PaaG [Cellvibrionales bacterium]|nr:2-(1,2-epoxy-1,2-dihydrophenyl)acetyl-CoA isomerase PaaG [Porticoccaceae bacterium]|tara:strand:+ start:22745 stop:23545 length:801 start_codon:yes stop_codon:yes gene_type:complete